MISAVIYNPHTKERESLLKVLRQAAAVLTEEKWQIEYFDKQEQLDAFLKEDVLLDLIGYDVSGRGSISHLEQLRSRYQEPLLLLIADASMSPMEYIRPTILASSLLLRPLTPEKLRSAITELVENLMDQHQQSGEEALLVETREGKTYVPFSKIYYFEAREKKIYIRLKKQELTFYDTLENLSSRLPEMFIRCHRSFIVNKLRIQKVMLSKSVIELEQGMELPLSRSYKPAFKELL